MQYAVQMYALRSVCVEDLKAGLRAAAEAGYTGVEFAGYFGHSAQTVAGWLKEYQLEAMGAHIHIDEICADVDGIIAYQKALGNTRIISPAGRMQTVEDEKELARKLNSVLPKIREAGMQLYHHNHTWEFAKAPDGRYLFELLAEDVPELRLEVDVYWAYRGGADAIAFMKKYADRMDIFHAKDGDQNGGTLAGQGAVALDEILAYTKRAGFAWAVVESEASNDANEQIDVVRKDYAYISSL